MQVRQYGTYLIMNTLKWIKIKFWQYVIYLIRKSYGANCPDYEETCFSCQAKDVIKFLEEHIDLIRFY